MSARDPAAAWPEGTLCAERLSSAEVAVALLTVIKLQQKLGLSDKQMTTVLTGAIEDIRAGERARIKGAS